MVLSFRNEGTVLDALASLAEQDEPLELVLSHSGGGPTPDLVRERFPGVRIAASEARRSPGAARNAGIDCSQAPYVGFLAGDCRARPGWAAGRLRRHRAGAEAVATAMVPPRATAAALASFLIQHSYRMAHVPPPPALRFGASYSRPLLERVGPFREDIPGEEDVELNERVIAAGVRIEWAPEVAVEHLYPEDARSLLADGYRRGSMRRTVRGGRRRWPVLAARALLDGPAGIRHALRPGSALARAEVARVAPLVLLGAAAYSAGVLRRG